MSGSITDIIACPGLDYCSLANARSIPVARTSPSASPIATGASRSASCSIKISRLHQRLRPPPCRAISASWASTRTAEEFYQITLGGKADEDPALGQLLGPAIPYEEVSETIERIVSRYLELRRSASERFIDTVKRLGTAPFKEALYALH